MVNLAIGKDPVVTREAFITPDKLGAFKTDDQVPSPLSDFKTSVGEGYPIREVIGIVAAGKSAFFRISKVEFPL